MLRVALRPRFLGLLALMVAATVVCGLLAGWQWDRAHDAMTEKADGPQQLGDLRDVLQVGDAVTNEIVGDLVTATGTYVPGEQVIVPGRSIDGTEAALVVSALRVERADGTQVRLPVARGWLPAAEVTGADGEIDPSLAPDPPSGEVEISGRLEASEAATGGVADGVADEIATPQLVNAWGAPMYSGYVALETASDGLQALPAAESQFSRGLDWQNIGYSFQWVLFGAFFLYLWWRSVRSTYLDELAERREAIEALLTAQDGASPDDETEPSADGAAPVDGAAPAARPNPTPAAASAAPSSEKDV